MLKTIKFKAGVDLSKIKPETIQAMVIASHVFDYHVEDCVVTSVCDGKHMKGSKHYEGYAFDLRSRHLEDEQIDSIVEMLRDELGKNYDVVDETKTISPHIHVEYDPK